MVKNLPAMWETWVGDLGLIPGLGRSPGEGNRNPLQYSYLFREAWWATVRRLQRVGHDFSSVTQLCPTLCDPMDCMGVTPGLSISNSKIIDCRLF